jgi:NADPH-dependent curcumin reductase CurA
MINRQVRVVKRAAGVPSADVFELVLDTAMPTCPDGGVCVRVRYAAVDPAMRGWLSAERNYLSVPDGAVMRAEGIGEIIESRHPDWHPGDLAYGMFGWQQYAAARAKDLYWRIDANIAPPPVWLGALGFNGLTAWIGFAHLARPRHGETVLVSTAAGAVGSVVASLARSRGLTSVGITGGAGKVRRCVETLGYAVAVDYKSASDLAGAVAEACPKGIDIYYDNTGGAIADAVFPALTRGARIIQCGSASVASWLPVPTGPRRERDMIVKRLSWQGFVVVDHADLFEQALSELKQLYAAGMLDTQTDILEGLDAAPGALEYLYKGLNQGRLCIHP